MPKPPTIQELVDLVAAAAAEAADYQERFAAEDTEARKIVDVMERYLRVRGRVVYGGAAINAHLSAERKFYDPALYLPDYDFLTPDPLQDCADLIVAFQQEGFDDVEAKFGIHEGTYKVFVNYRAAADITYMPPAIYDRIATDADTIDGIRYASVNYLRMNMYLELSRPSGDVSRWEKVYKRLLLLNEEHPPKAGRCAADVLGKLEAKESEKTNRVHDRIVSAGIAAGAVFLSGANYLVNPEGESRTDEVVLMLTDKPAELTAALKQAGLRATQHEALGELLPARTEFHTTQNRLVGVVFETVACHAYTTLHVSGHGDGYRLASVDLMIQMYYALYFADIQDYLPVRLLCVIQELIEFEADQRRSAVSEKRPAHDVFPLECVGYQPTLPELKKAHRKRVAEKRKELKGAMHLQSSVRVTRKRRR